MASSEYLREDAALRHERADHDVDAARPPQLPRGLPVPGNAAAQRILRSGGHGGAGHAEADAEIEDAIRAQRGGGQQLDATVGRTMSEQIGTDFSDVRIHTDERADALNRSVQADAFTVGNDIFFRRGNYEPGTARGNHLLAHELTHVAQQRGAPSGDGSLTISEPQDQSEQQASAVAERVSSGVTGDHATVARQEATEEEELQPSSVLNRQDAMEEEELQASPTLSRQEEPEEEELQMSPHLAREETEEEEPLPA